MSVDRILQHTSEPISVALSVGGTPTDPVPDAALVTITRADGTAVVTNTNAADAGTGVFSYQLTSADTALLDVLTATWSVTKDGQEQQYRTTHEIVGGFLFTVAELRGLSTSGGGLANVTNYPADRLVAMRTRVEQALEDACGVAFVPRYGQEVFRGTLPPRVAVLRHVTENGTSLEPLPDVQDLTFLTGTVVVGYEHGHLVTPERVRQAALLLAKQWLTPTAVDDRAITMSNDTGTYSLFQAGVRGHVFSIPEVQATVDMYSETVMVA